MPALTTQRATSPTVTTPAPSTSAAAPVTTQARGNAFAAEQLVVGESSGALNDCFSGSPSLVALAGSEKGSLSKKDNGPAVMAVQQALLDLGYALPKYGADGGLGTVAADGRIDMTVAFGEDENGIIPCEIDQFRKWITERGFTPTVGTDGNAEHYHRMSAFTVGQKTVNADGVLRVVLPGSTAEESFSDALAKDEVVYYAGHARYGSGPDFDDDHHTDENFVIGTNAKGHADGSLTPAYDAHIPEELAGKGNDLERMSRAGKFDARKYQVWAFGACSTIRYLDELRGGRVEGKNRSNLDLLGTGQPIYRVHEADATIAFIDGLLRQSSVQKMVQDMNTVSPEAEWWQNGAPDNPTAP